MNLVGSVADPDPPDSYNFPGSAVIQHSYQKSGWIRIPDPYQIIRLRIQLKPLKSENKSHLRREILVAKNIGNKSDLYLSFGYFSLNSLSARRNIANGYSAGLWIEI